METIPPSIRRFILTSIDSVPHLEAVLLLSYDAGIEWDAKMMSQRLYLAEKKAAELLSDLAIAGFAIAKGDEGNPLYSYHPATPELREALAQLNQVYAKNLIEVTNLIHSKISKQAQKFGDAFKWKNERGQ
jgi:hypothetical protein